MDKQQRLFELAQKPRMYSVSGDSVNPGQSIDGLLQMINKYYNYDFKVAEIGSYSGGSTEVFALCCQCVYSIDPYNDNDLPEQEGVENLIEAEKIFIEKMKSYNNVTKIRKLSLDAVNDFEDGSLDAVYIDGNHSYESVIKDIKAWYPKVRNMGIISGHDYYEDIKRAIDETIKEPIESFPDASWAAIKASDELR